eukprot:CAMPEP_0203947202 /NCGR_PEP_ID=MMETSP0359-20131031/82240_1 /ASSEMBLY_ACC=CAM_ASM_000338 /TAXON_ID=268821 /ORGANISM="Scrippsiella Hangoei, Strain SHTV-5" /LENGTH=34 /DNA_ID= /DNA_START= /DNA_END= /DNA_ORIENTATION=
MTNPGMLFPEGVPAPPGTQPVGQLEALDPFSMPS